MGGRGLGEVWDLGDWERWAAGGAPPLTHLPSPQLCCCARQKDPVCQSLHCLLDGEAVTLPVVSAWVWEAAQLSLELLGQGEGENLGGRGGG